MLAALGAGSPIVQLDMRNNNVYFANLQDNSMAEEAYDTDAFSGPIYFEDPLHPKNMYTWHNGHFREYSINRCKVKSQSRPISGTYDWLRSAGHGCESLDTHKIGEALLLDRSNGWYTC